MSDVLKVIGVILAIATVVVLGIYIIPKIDKNPATVSITSSGGYAETCVTKNDSLLNLNKGKKTAIATGKKLILNKGETIHVEFQCDACGKKEEVDISQPFAKVFSCDCTGKKGNSKEYFSLTVEYKNNKNK